MASFVILLTARTARIACSDRHTSYINTNKRTNRQTHETTTVTLSAHARRGLISTAHSLAKKLKVIEAVEKGDKSHRDVAKEFSTCKSTVMLLCCKKSKIRKQLSLL